MFETAGTQKWQDDKAKKDFGNPFHIDYCSPRFQSRNVNMEKINASIITCGLKQFHNKICNREKDTLS